MQEAAYALDCQAGGNGYPGDGARKWAGLAGGNAGRKYSEHQLGLLSSRLGGALSP